MLYSMQLNAKTVKYLIAEKSNKLITKNTYKYSVQSNQIFNNKKKTKTKVNKVINIHLKEINLLGKTC